MTPFRFEFTRHSNWDLVLNMFLHIPMCTCVGMTFYKFLQASKITISKVVELLAEIGKISKHTKSVRSSLQMQATNLMVLPLIYHSSSSTILYSTYNILRLNGSKVSVPFSRINPQWMRTR